MLFNSYEFLLFLPIVLLLYWGLNRWLHAQNVLLVLASYLFYAWWDLRFLALIVGITLVGYLCGWGISRAGTDSRRSRALCALCIAACLGTLGAFKYYNFFITNLNGALASAHIDWCLPLWQVVLPVGISFYTFQVLSYTIDVKRGKMEACLNPVSFAAFVSFFPQLVAGPIERATNLLPQMQQRRTVRYADVADGLRLMLWGFTKKMLLADRCAPLVNAIYSNPQADGTDLWMGTLLFAFQIYGDFSGYSDIAIGTARLFGIQLTTNFNLPYFARNVADFWRRWHISLMTWFKDYLYIPLGGSRQGQAKRIRNTLAVFLASGIWHGANWTFIAWGIYHALWFIPLIGLRSASGKPATESSQRLLPSLSEACQITTTFLIICIGWMIFRSDTLNEALHHVSQMFCNLQPHTPYGGWSALSVPLCIWTAEWVTRSRRHPLDFPATGLLRFRGVRWCIYYALILCILYYGGHQSAFIYFQF